MTSTECNTCRELLSDLLLDPQAVPPHVANHVMSCAECRTELNDLQATMALMDVWSAPEPSAYFDTRLHARLRAEIAKEPEGVWERLNSFLRFSTGRGFRPAMIGALSAVLLLGGGTAATLLVHHEGAAAASPTVNDLKIYDNNAQAVDQMDLLDDTGSADGAPQS